MWRLISSRLLCNQADGLGAKLSPPEQIVQPNKSTSNVWVACKAQEDCCTVFTVQGRVPCPGCNNGSKATTAVDASINAMNMSEKGSSFSYEMAVVRGCSGVARDYPHQQEGLFKCLNANVNPWLTLPKQGHVSSNAAGISPATY